MTSIQIEIPGLKCFDSDIMNKALDLFWSNTIHIEVKSSENGENSPIQTDLARLIRAK